MNDIAYCYEKAAAPGSAFYYSVMHLPKNQRDACVIIAAFYQEVEKSLFDCREPELAKIKIQWWRNEAAKLSLGKPEHPVSIALQKVVNDFHLPAQSIVDMIDGIEGLYTVPAQTLEQYLQYIENSVGVREKLIAHIADANLINTKAIGLLTPILEITYQIQNIRLFLHAGLVLFAEDQLQQWQVVTDKFVSFVPLFNDLYARQKQFAEKAAEILKNTNQKPYLSLIIRSKIALAVMEEIKASGYAVFENFVNITPIRRWWIKTKILWAAL